MRMESQRSPLDMRIRRPGIGSPALVASRDHSTPGGSTMNPPGQPSAGVSTRPVPTSSAAGAGAPGVACEITDWQPRCLAGYPPAPQQGGDAMTSPQVALPAPSSGTRRPFDFRIPITLCVIAVLCGFFWIGSRYPSLQGKASADPNEALSTPLGFERFFPEPPADQRLKHIAWTSVEWGITNRQGMTYGLLLAAAIMTVLPLIRRRRGGKLAGALQGMMIGAPLGVCVNCAAPIAQGMLKAGGRVETALATLVSSPTFNVIVLGIVFTLFPWYLAVLKILSGVFIVLVVVPWLARLAERPGWSRPQPVEARLPGLYLFQKLESLLGTPQLAAEGDSLPPKGPLRALGWVVLHYTRNLGRVLVTALPLMLLAGVLGAI